MNAAPTSARPRVLLVEDEARIAQFVAKGLDAAGLDVTVAEDGDVGAFLAATEPYDLVLLDVGLPGTRAWRSSASYVWTGRPRRWSF